MSLYLLEMSETLHMYGTHENMTDEITFPRLDTQQKLLVNNSAS